MKSNLLPITDLTKLNETCSRRVNTWVSTAGQSLSFHISFRRQRNEPKARTASAHFHISSQQISCLHSLLNINKQADAFS